MPVERIAALVLGSPRIIFQAEKCYYKNGNMARIICQAIDMARYYYRMNTPHKQIRRRILRPLFIRSCRQF